MTKKVIGICGSLRAGSWNLKLLRAFSQEFPATLYPSIEMPLFNEDLEKSPDASITKFRASLKEAEIVLMASPEYNGSFSPALKNAIDWASRGENLWAGKTIVLLSASPGGFGGIRGLIQLRTVLSGIKSWVIPEQVICPSSHTAFNEEGSLMNEAVKKQIATAIAGLHSFLEH